MYRNTISNKSNGGAPEFGGLGDKGFSAGDGGTRTVHTLYLRYMPRIRYQVLRYCTIT